jgi:beta-N-acetylhexosaminidase
LKIFSLFFFALSTLSGGTLEENIGQMIITSFHGNELNEGAKQLIDEAKIGGVVYFKHFNGLESADQVTRLSADLQAYSLAKNGRKLLICADEEGGRISRFVEGVPRSPGNEVLGKGEPEEARLLAREVARGLLAMEVNCNLAPVVDINSNPKNPVIGNRSFGSSPEQVSLFGGAVLEGYLEGGVLPCLKHFPGHGDTSQDSHYELPLVDKSFTELLECELVPYLALAKKAPMIMTAHVLYPELDWVNPATLSRKILQGLLRERLGYQGVIITDSLTMEGILVDSIEEVAIRAVLAGADLLLLGEPNTVEQVLRIHRALVRAVEEGRIPRERIDESVARIAYQIPFLY